MVCEYGAYGVCECVCVCMWCIRCASKKEHWLKTRGRDRSWYRTKNPLPNQITHQCSRIHRNVGHGHISERRAAANAAQKPIGRVLKHDVHLLASLERQLRAGIEKKAQQRESLDAERRIRKATLGNPT